MTRKRKNDDLELTIKGVEENGDVEIYIEHRGVRVAKRGKPGTPHFKQWIPLQLGWVIRDYNYAHGIEIVQFPEMGAA
jgi:hypothetical protein